MSSCSDVAVMRGRTRCSASPHLPEHEHGAKRELGRGKRERLPRHGLIDAVHFVEHLAGLDFGDEVLGVALAVAHAHLGGLLRDGLVRKDADEDAPAALDVAGHRAAGRLDLARGEPPAGRRFESVFPKANLGPAGGDAPVASLLLLAVLGSCRLKHGNRSSPTKPWACGTSSPRSSASFPTWPRSCPWARLRPFSPGRDGSARAWASPPARLRSRRRTLPGPRQERAAPFPRGRSKRAWTAPSSPSSPRAPRPRRALEARPAGRPSPSLRPCIPST